MKRRNKRQSAQKGEKTVEIGGDLAEMQQKIGAALKLIDSEAADNIIGTPGAEHKTLLEAVQALHGVQWSTMQSFGLRKVPGSLRAMSQHQVIVLTLVHYAYALGVQRGRDESAS